MGNICIITDSSAQFPSPQFPGKQLVKIIPLEICLHGTKYKENEIKVKNLPYSIEGDYRPILIVPSTDKIRKYFINISQTFDEIICIFTSSHLCPYYNYAHEALASLGEKLRIQLIDSQSISTGLGFLVQSAAEALDSGASSTEIERLVCSLIPHIYSVLCIPSLSYLYQNGHLDQAQAILGEMLELLPFFSLEEGRLAPLEKMRNQRQTLDFYQEFLGEFDALSHIGLLQSTPPHSQMARLLREHIRNYYPDSQFTEHRINVPLATMLGPRTMGIIAVEALNHRSN